VNVAAILSGRVFVVDGPFDEGPKGAAHASRDRSVTVDLVGQKVVKENRLDSTVLQVVFQRKRS
jgi:hypothetical protein